MQAKRIGQVSGVIFANIFSPVLLLLQFIPGGSQKLHAIIASPKAVIETMNAIQIQVQQHPLEITFGFVGVVLLVMVIDIAYIWLMAKLGETVAEFCAKRLVTVKATAVSYIQPVINR